MTLISSQGKTCRLSGPYDGAIDATPTQPDGLLDALSRLIAESKNPRTTLAVFRGWSRGVPVGRPDILGVDITRSGSYCLRPDRPITLWWPTAKSGGNIKLERKTDKRSLLVVWPKGVKAVHWPNALPVVDGGEYAVDFFSPPTRGENNSDAGVGNQRPLRRLDVRSRLHSPGPGGIERAAQRRVMKSSQSVASPTVTETLPTPSTPLADGGSQSLNVWSWVALTVTYATLESKIRSRASR